MGCRTCIKDPDALVVRRRTVQRVGGIEGRSSSRLHGQRQDVWRRPKDSLLAPGWLVLVLWSREPTQNAEELDVITAVCMRGECARERELVCGCRGSRGAKKRMLF